jgi:MFS family permease
MTTLTSAARPRRMLARIAPFALMIFFGYLTVGLPLAVLSLHVHDTLGFGDLAVGVTIGIQSLATLLTRQLAGNLCDCVGSKTSVLAGGIVLAAAALIYLASTIAGLSPAASLGVLLFGRGMLGVGESLLMTGALAWAIGAVGSENTGKVMVWVGIAMYAAIAAGAPLGMQLMLEQHVVAGFVAISLGTLLFCLLALGLAAITAPVAPPRGERMPFLKVVTRVAPFGAGLALATVGFSAIAAFAALDYHSRGWTGAGLALAGFGAAYILTRLMFGGLPDRLGGIRVAIASLLIETVGQALLWLAPTPVVALGGAILTGIGFSLVFPSFGIEAVRGVPPTSRGAALGAYVAFFDIGAAVAAPATGLVTSAFGYSSAFATGALAAAAALVLAGRAARASVTVASR